MGDDARSDAELLEAFQKGDVASFEALYQRHREWAAAIARRFTRDDHGAMDVLQDAFAYVLMRPPSLHAGATFRSFMYPVIKHTALATRRKERSAVHGVMPAASASLDDAVQNRDDRKDVGSQRSRDEADEAMDRLRGALAKLPDAQREVLVMRTVDGMSLQEIAVALSIPLGTVKSRLHHALTALQQDEATRRYFG